MAFEIFRFNSFKQTNPLTEEIYWTEPISHLVIYKETYICIKCYGMDVGWKTNKVLSLHIVSEIPADACSECFDFQTKMKLCAGIKFLT
jgi:hypothetical protein